MLSIVTGIWCLYNIFDHSVRQQILVWVLTHVYTVSVALAMEGPLRTLKAGPLLAM